MKVMVLFISLLDNYQHLILALESLKLEDRTWDDVNIRLLNEELMRKEKGGLSNEVALFAQRQSDSKKVWEVGAKMFATIAHNLAIGIEIVRKKIWHIVEAKK